LLFHLGVFLEKTYNSSRMEQVKAPHFIRSVTFKGLVLFAVGLLLFGWLFNTPEGLLGKADAIGYAVCHRIDARSFHLGDRQVPLCARCSGMYLGAMLGLAYQSLLGRRRSGMPPWRVLIVLGLIVVAFGIDGVNSYLHLFPFFPSLYEPQNWLRLLTGTGMGIGMSAVLLPAFHQTVWVQPDEGPALPGLRSLGGLLLLGLVLDAIVLTENPLVLYPLALLSAVGVLVLLVMVYTMIWLMVTRDENRFDSLIQLGFALSAGFGLALMQIAALDFVRYLLTGTWDGFHFG
jgi:uncharacterized membrane protein